MVDPSVPTTQNPNDLSLNQSLLSLSKLIPLGNVKQNHVSTTRASVGFLDQDLGVVHPDKVKDDLVRLGFLRGPGKTFGALVGK